MALRTAKSRVAAALALLLVSGIAWAGSAAFVAPIDFDRLHPVRERPETGFKLKAGGQLDMDTMTVTFAGQASHYGQFTATGTYDPVLSVLHGTMDCGGDGHTVTFTITFGPGNSGEVPAEFTGLGGPGWPLYNSNAVATGTITLDDDFMFTLDVDGTFQKCTPDETRSCT